MLLNYHLSEISKLCNSLAKCLKHGYKFKVKLLTGKGQNYENHNVENQKELRKLRRRSEHRKDL